MCEFKKHGLDILIRRMTIPFCLIPVLLQGISFCFAFKNKTKQWNGASLEQFAITAAQSAYMQFGSNIKIS